MRRLILQSHNQRRSHLLRQQQQLLKRLYTTKIGIFGDIHFQDVGLKRVERTGEWILNEFRKENVSSIVCLGDVLNTRETVSVQSLSSAIRFFEELATLNVPIHILLGNHDMNLKHDSRISSLDVLGMKQMSNLFHLYRDITRVNIDGQDCVLIPYQEDQNRVKQWILDNSNKNSDLSRSVGFGHLSIPGAIQRYQKDDSNNLFMKRFHEGDNNETSNRVPSYYNQFKYLVSGHFHHHHYLNSEKSIVYCGSPMQHHFGDSGDDQRGILIYTADGETSNMKFIQNPEWDAFRIAKIEKESDLEPISQYNGKHVAVVYQAADLNPDRIQSKLINAGALQVKKHSISVKRVHKSTSTVDNKSSTVVRPGQGFDEVVDPYIALYDFSQNPQFQQRLVEKGKELINTVSKKLTSSGSQQMFRANLKSVIIENFLGVQDCIEFNVSNLEDGVWYIEGANGSGKSTLLEAITWCLFNRFLRTDMKAAYAVNDVAKKNCRVSVVFDNGFTIERFRKYSDDNDNTNSSNNVPARKGTGVRVLKDGQYLSEFERGSIKDSQTAIERLIGIDFDTFSKSTIVGESVFNFLSSDAKQRREMIEDLLGLNQFDDYLTEVREQRKRLLTDTVTSGRSREDSRNFISATKLLIPNMQLHRSELEKEKISIEEILKTTRNNLNSIEKQLTIVQESLKKERELILVQTKLTTLDQLKNRVSQLGIAIANEMQAKQKLTSEEDYQKLLESQKLLEQMIEGGTKQLQNTITSKAVLNNELTAVNSSIRELEKLMSSHECPYCSQSIQECTITKMKSDIEEKVSKRQQIEQQIQNSEDKITQIQNKIEHIRQLLEAKSEEVSNAHHDILSANFIDKELNRLMSEKQKSESEITDIMLLVSQSQLPDNVTMDSFNNLNEQHDMLQKESRSLYRIFVDHESKLKQMSQDMNNLDKDIQKQTETLELEESKLKTLDETAIENELNVSCLNFWERAFERRSRKLDEVDLSEPSDSPYPLTKRSSKQFITMRSYLLEQSIDDLNKILLEYTQLLGPNSLPVSFDYDFMIREEYGKRSAGQRKRNHLVIFFGLFELVRQQSRFISNFLMLDEVFDAMDQSGQERVKEVIQLIATQHVDKVFIITHNMLRSSDQIIGGYGGLHLIRAEMTNKGTKYHIH
jgi:ABC-type thiamine transport system ATPase subunit/predicted phosphodiesterase